jgi:hypothetical protein
MWHNFVEVPRPQRDLSWLWCDLKQQVEIELLFKISEEIEDKGEALLDVFYIAGEDLDGTVPNFWAED